MGGLWEGERAAGNISTRGGGRKSNPSTNMYVYTAYRIGKIYIVQSSVSISSINITWDFTLLFYMFVYNV